MCIRDRGCTIPFKRIIKLLTSPETSKTKINFFSGHDTSLIPIVKALLSLNNEDDLAKFPDCPFNSNLVIEQYLNKDQDEIKIYFNNQEIRIRENKKCSLKKFKEFVEPYSIENLKQYCQI
eukprot:TRINITY_DN10828_c0_g1_i1.p3 TRINITY_DN10828_c0_g1~~TRINITY_DN10828_c0_g1_i1.p3  ORF type:complete len:121 (-),score=21.78 TRINITY_DN10828_c0_g1_i1:60-422(-)